MAVCTATCTPDSSIEQEKQALAQVLKMATLYDMSVLTEAAVATNLTSVDQLTA